MGTDVNLILPKLGESYDFYVVAFSDAPNVLPSACSKVTTIGLSKFYSIRRAGSSSVVVEMLLYACTICSSSFHLFTEFLCPHA